MNLKECVEWCEEGGNFGREERKLGGFSWSYISIISTVPIADGAVPTTIFMCNTSNNSRLLFEGPRSNQRFSCAR